MTGLLSVLPLKARLLVDGDDVEKSTSTVDAPHDSIFVGDKIIVLPGISKKKDRIPADGIVTASRSTVDESSFTGEPLPITKVLGVMIASL
uniref:P-type ATPase A domain-containing protein n=1 Tax=Lactuca sativa TaxID=4236 RepID=A0A9R1UP67_LACSA|nr:hypothetical protein LSAT_V11C800419060 [Lactuca sativa]